MSRPSGKKTPPARRVHGHTTANEAKWETVKTRGAKKCVKKDETEVKQLEDDNPMIASQDLFESAGKSEEVQAVMKLC